MGEFEDIISDPNSLYEDKVINDSAFNNLIKNFLNQLSEKEKFVILSRKGFYDNEEKSYSKIAKELYLKKFTQTIL